MDISKEMLYTFYKNLVNELHDWIDKHPSVIHSQILSYSIFVKVNGTLLKKHTNLLQIYVREIHK